MKSPTLVRVKCKGCNLIVELGNNTLKDFKDGKTNLHHYEFIYKTGFCQGCLIEKGYCS